jgi:hypothetical protein
MGPAEVELQNHATRRHDLPANSLRGVENTKEASLLCPGRIRAGTRPQGRYYFKILDTADVKQCLSENLRILTEMLVFSSRSTMDGRTGDCRSRWAPDLYTDTLLGFSSSKLKAIF